MAHDRVGYEWGVGGVGGVGGRVEGHCNTVQEVFYFNSIFYALLYIRTSKSRFFMQMSVCFSTGNA